ncbi:hypothetical protein, partial [Marinobacter salarius]|uniref:hypothetical protein n=1 Tax=Marinobacter salarius TaxID=1420917 RepID=UPI0024203C38
ETRILSICLAVSNFFRSFSQKTCNSLKNVQFSIKPVYHSRFSLPPSQTSTEWLSVLPSSPCDQVTARSHATFDPRAMPDPPASN